MVTDVYTWIDAAILTGLAETFPFLFTGSHVCIPDRNAHAGCFCPAPISAVDAAMRLTKEQPFPDVLGVPPVESVEGRQRRLLFTLTDDFFDAAARLYMEELPYPDGDLGDHALNRMMALSRQGRALCPREESVQRVLLTAAGLAGGHTSMAAVRRACREMGADLPPRERRALRSRCGDAGDAIARLMFDRLQKGNRVNEN